MVSNNIEKINRYGNPISNKHYRTQYQNVNIFRGVFINILISVFILLFFIIFKHYQIIIIVSTYIYYNDIL